MTDDIVNRILAEGDHELDRTESLFDTVREAFSRQMRTLTYIIASILALCVALAIWVAILFFRAEATWYIVFYATLFNVLMLAIALTRMFMWQTLHKRQIQRDIRRLELLIRSELASQRGKTTQ
jgi:hypothetical protein